MRGSSPHSHTLFDTSPSSLPPTDTPVSRASIDKTEDELVKVCVINDYNDGAYKTCLYCHYQVLIYSEADLRKIVQQVRNECIIQVPIIRIHDTHVYEWIIVCIE